MIEIKTVAGDSYSYDLENKVVYKEGVPNFEIEPVFSDIDGATRFSGLYLKSSNTIISLTGKIHSNTSSEKL